MLRSTLLHLSEQRWLRHWMENSAASRKMTSRFVAGRTLSDGITVLKNLTKDNMLGTLDYLGENVKNLDEAAQSRDSYLAALDQISREKLRASVSLKLTQFGLDLSESACLENVSALVASASQIGTRVEIDMESSVYTDRTLAMVKEMQARFPGHVRAVIQAYLFRSEADIKSLSELASRSGCAKVLTANQRIWHFPANRMSIKTTSISCACCSLKALTRRLRAMTKISFKPRFDTFRNKTLILLVLNFRCSMAFAGICNASSSQKASVSAYMSLMATLGIHTSCAALPNGQPIFCSSPRTLCAPEVTLPQTEPLLLCGSLKS